MANPRLSLDADSIGQESAWLRRLARALVAGGSADDLVQDTWLTWLSHPPARPGPVRAWLGTVLRNAARKQRRSDHRRRRREQAALPAGASAGQLPAIPSTEELAVRLEAQRLVGELVLTLAEPYRTTVLLVFFEGLAPTEIARRLQVPAGTVRWRLSHALDQLRTKLDQQYDQLPGDRPRSWRAVLLPLTPSPPPSPSSPLPSSGGLLPLGGILAVKASTKVAAVIIAAVLLGGLSTYQWRTRAAAPDAPSAQAPGEQAPGAPPIVARPAEPAAGKVDAPGKPWGVHRPGARTPVPRFAPPPAPIPSAEAPPRPPKLVPSTGKGPTNRLGYVPANFEQMKVEFERRMTTVNELAQRCLDDFPSTDPSLKEGVMLGIEVDDRGLQQVWVGDRTAIPSGQLACLSNAVYQLDWSGITDKPLTFTDRIRAADSGNDSAR